MPYDLYPAVDETYNFPPVVRGALAKSLDLRNTVIPMTTVQRNNLVGVDLWNGRLILNTTTNRINRYDLTTASWLAVAEFNEINAHIFQTVQLHLSTAVGLAVTVWQTLRTFSKISDESNLFNTATGLFVAPVAGLYMFEGTIVFPPGINNGIRVIALWDAASPNDSGNATGAELAISRRSVNGEGYSVPYQHVMRMTAGLGYKLRVYSGDSAPGTLVVGPQTTMIFRRIGP